MTGRERVLARLRTSPFLVLWRTFVVQFYTSESLAVEVQLRQTIASVLAFLIVPGIFIVSQTIFSYPFTVLRASTLGMPGLVDQFLIAMGAVFVVFSTITTGFIAAFLWDTLAFDRRDAMVLAPLPLRGATIVMAKVAALSALLLGASVATNLVSAVPFALVTADRPDGTGLIGHFTAHLGATLGAATFVFASTVVLRGLVGALCGPRIAAAAGSVLQFLFVSALLCVIVLIPAVSPARLAEIDLMALRWVPPAWFLGVFERGLALSQPHFVSLADRALPATLIAVLAAVATSALGFHREMRRALAPSASSGPLGGAGLSRLLARGMVGRDAVARATSEFILLTLARSRSQRVPIAMNAAIGMAVVVAALSRVVTDLDSLLRPRTVVLWIPLVLAYWLVVGLRASFFVPSELPSAWAFRVNGPEHTPSYWSAIRASTIAYALPRMLAVIALLVPVVGARVAAWHALVASVLLVLLVEVLALTLRHVPFTREYRPGHARLKSRWPLYLLGMFAFAYWPTQVELRLLQDPGALVTMVTCILMAIVGLEIVGRWMARRGTWQYEHDEADDSVTVLDISGALSTP